MLMEVGTPAASRRNESFELQVFRDGHWIAGAVFDERTEALREALRLDRSGKLLRLQTATLDASGKVIGTHTLYLKHTNADSRQGIATRTMLSRRPASRADGHPSAGLNPYTLLATFSLIVFFGIAAILALRTLHDAV
jgi:hypothetical protein